ncbi:hypothetical protein [Streptomyces sp. NPDC058434]|uniref:hypothetical protein n=1 Tax=Streptomyces sp. NPDC058434 TaxID=3346498 RepID=UPI00365FBEF1
MTTQDLTTQDQFDAFTAEVARELGTHCRTASAPNYGTLARLIADGDGRALHLRQPDYRNPRRLKIFAALPEGSQVPDPSIGVTASSARHVAREITRRLHPKHAEAAEQAAQITARQQAEASARRAVAEALAGALPGAHVDEACRRTRIAWERASRPPEQRGPIQVDSVCVIVGASGEEVTVEASGLPAHILPMLVAFAEAPRE